MATTFLKVSNYGKSTLYADISSAVQTSIQIVPGHTTRFPNAGNFIAILYDNSEPSVAVSKEEILVTAVSGNTWTVTRGYNGSTAFSSLSIGVAVQLPIRAEHVQELQTAVNTAENNIATHTTALAGLIIGTHVQAYDADLTAWAGKTAPSGTAVGTSDTQTLTNKTLSTSTKLDANADQNFTYYGVARQAVINGNFSVWQRNTTNTYAGGSGFGPTYIADRWFEYHDNGGSGSTPQIITSRQSLTSGELFNSFYFHRTAVNGAGSGMGATQQGLTGHNIEFGTRFLCGDGKQVTVSFWARSSIASKKLGLSLTQIYGTGGSPSSDEILQGTTFNLTTSWAKYTHTFTTNTLVGKTFGTNNNDYLAIHIWSAWGSTQATNRGFGSAETYVGSGNIDIAQVQLCAGNTALPFQPKSFQEELTDCQRYYEKSYAYATVPGTAVGAGVGSYIWDSSGGNFALSPIVQFKVSKRAAPTITIYSPVTGTTGKIRNNSTAADINGNSDRITEHSVLVFVNNVATTAGDDLCYEWVAESEL